MRRILVIGRDLISATRIIDAAVAAGYTAERFDRPVGLPSPADVAVVVVDWADRDSSWGETLRSWRGDAARGPRVLLYGPHTDLVAHDEARRHGLGPMLARSRLFSSLPELLGP